MKKLRIKRLISIIGLSALFGLSSSIIASCVQNKQSNQDERIIVSKISFNEIKEDSATIVIELKNEIVINSNETNIEIKDVVNSSSFFYKPIINNKKIVFNIDKLQPDLRYFINSLVINNKKIDISSQLKTDFQTLPKEENLLINIVDFFDISTTSTKFKIKHNFNDLSLLNDLEFIFNHKNSIKLLNAESNYAIYQLNDLLPNTNYKIKNIKLKDKTISYNNDVNFFTTKAEHKENKLTLSNFEVKNSISSNVLIFKLNQDITNANISLLINEKNYFFNNISSNKKQVTLKLENLSFNKQYKITKMTIDQTVFDLDYSFYTLQTNSNNNSHQDNNSNNNSQNPKNDKKPETNDVPSKQEENSTNQQPNNDVDNNINIDNFLILNKTSSSVKLRVNFDKNITYNPNNVFLIKLTNDISKEVNQNLTNKNFVDFNIENLLPDTTYNVLDFKLNNISILKQNSFSFRTNKQIDSDNNNSNANNTFVPTQPEPSIVSRTIFYDDELNVVDKNSNYFNNVKMDSSWSSYFNFINQSSNAVVNEDFKRTAQNEIIDFKIINNKLIIKLKVVDNPSNSLNLIIKRKNQSHTISATNKSNNIIEYEIQNLDNGESIEVVGLLNNNQVVHNFKHKNFIITNKKINNQSNAFSFRSNTEWKLWSANSSQYIFNLSVWRLISNIYWPDAFALKILNNQNQIEYINLNYKSRKETEPREIEAMFPKAKVNKILGLVLKNNNQYYDLTNFNHIIEKPYATEFVVESNFNINSINVQNNIVKVNYNNDLSLDAVDFLVKSTNPLEPWSKIINASIDHANKTANFNIDSLPQNISKYIIVAAQINDEVIDYGLNPKYQFQTNLINKQFELTNFQIIKDENNKQLYGSAKFNFNESDFNFFKNKWIQFIFEPEIKSNEEEYYAFNFVKDYKINVPFNKIWKFGLNGFFENTKYILKSIKAIEPYTQNDYYNNFVINNSVNKDFIYKYNYQVQLDEQLISDANNIEFNSNDTDLITKRTDLNKQDLINIWLSNETRSKIPYSIQNHYALIEYERYHFYKNAAGDIKPRKNFILINQQGEEVNLRVIAGRKIIDHAIPTIAEDHKKATIIEDLSQYHGLETIQDEAIFIFRLELDNQKRKLTEITPLDPASTTAKSFISIAVSYKDIKQKNIINEAAFSFLQTRGDVRLHKTIFKQMKDRFQFKVSLVDNKLKLEIIPKYNNVLLFDSLSDHFFSLANSSFIGNVSTTLHWIKTNNFNHNIDFHATALKDNLSTSLNETFIDNTTNKNTNELFLKNVKLKNKQDSTKRLFKQNNSKSTNNIRSRSFAFMNRPNGTWSVLGKVKPNDDSDYNYYVISNSHVWKVFAQNAGITIDGNEYKILNNTHFKVPIILDTPSDLNAANINPYFDNANTWILDNVNFKIEAIVDYDNDNSYPHPRVFKDTYAESLRTSNGYDEWVLGRADLIIAKVDMSFFFKNFSLETIDDATYNGVALNTRQKEIVKFFLSWKNLDFMQISPYNHHLSEYYNLNWFSAPYPGLASNNKDSIKGKRYREYLLANTNDIFGVVNYLGTTSKNLLVKFDTNLVDVAGGASGTSVYDSKNRLVGLFVEATKGASSNEKGEAGIFIIDGHKFKFFGDGTTPQNQGSFYERVRLLSYLYPHRYENDNFKKLPTFYNAIED